MQALVSTAKEGIRVTLRQLRVEVAVFQGESQIQTLDYNDSNSTVVPNPLRIHY
jgi:hypothetical protein